MEIKFMSTLTMNRKNCGKMFMTAAGLLAVSVFAGASLCVKAADSQLEPAYEAYLDLLVDKQAAIDSYNWQKGYFDGFEGYSDENTTRAVAFSDVTGDGIPELIYMEGIVNDGGIRICAALNIVTYQDGGIKTLYRSDGWDVNAGGGSHYCLFKKNGDSALYVFEDGGDEYWTYSCSRFSENEYGELAKSEVCRREDTADNVDGEWVSVHNYLVSGESAAEAEYLSTVEDLQNNTSEILMYNAHSGDFAESYVAQNGCQAMTCSESIAYLKEQVDVDHPKGERTPAPDLFSQIPSRYVFSSGAGAWGTELTLYPDGSFEGEYSDSDMGDSGDGYDATHYSSIFTGRFINPVKINDMVYAFELESISYEKPAGTEEIVSWDGGETHVREIYTDAYGLAGGKTFYLYVPGTRVSKLPEECVNWTYGVGGLSEDKKSLEAYGLYNTDEQYGFFGRPSQDSSQGTAGNSSGQPLASETAGHRYGVFLQNGTWEDAFHACREKGGHLVRIDSMDEYNQLLSELDSLGYRGYRLYIGGRRDLAGQQYYWADDTNAFVGEPLNDPNAWCAGSWMVGKPSFYDESINADEHVLEMFYYESENRWVWNDIPNNLPDYIGDATLNAGYICEYDN